MMTKKNDTLSFRVSAGLKNLIGRDYISFMKSNLAHFLLGHLVQRIISLEIKSILI